MEDASAHSGIKFLAALNGICAGGGYELALACDEIMLVDDSNSAVSLPETPLLGVLPGTGGLTRVVDKRKVRRDLADCLRHARRGREGQARGRVAAGRCDVSGEPVQGGRARARAQELAAQSDRPASGPGITLEPARRSRHRPTRIEYSSVSLTFDRAEARRDAHRPRARRAGRVDARGHPRGRRSVLAAARVPRARRRAAAAAVERAGDRHRRAEGRGRSRAACSQADDVLVRARRRTGSCARCIALHQAHAQARSTSRRAASSRSSSRAMLRRHAVRAGARGRSLVHAGRSRRPNTHSAVGHERGPVPDEQRAHAAAGALLRRAAERRSRRSRTTGRSIPKRRSRPAS